MSPILSDLDRHAGMDETGAWATCCKGLCSGGQSCDCPMPAEACSELLTPVDAPKRRLGPLNWIERALLRRNAGFWTALVAIGCFVLLLWASKP